MKAGPLNGAEERTRIKQTRVIYETACALAESTTLVEAAPRMLEAICEAFGWEYGAFWNVDRSAARLHCLATWHPPSLPFEDFAAISRQTEFASGIGLPGRVWASGKPAWIPDVVHDSNFPRAPFADRVGLHAAFGFPVLGGAEAIGVMEFFSQEIREPDEELLAMLTTVGSQIGLFVERKRAEEELDRFFTLSPDLLCIANFDGYFLRLNPSWERTLGIPREELLAKPWLDFVHPADREATVGAKIDGRERHAAHQFRESLSVRGWLVQVAAVDGRLVQGPRPDLRGRARRDRQEAGGPGARDRQAAGRRSDHRQGRVPGQHEPRDPHADERHHRHDRADPPHEAHAGTARLPAHRQGFERGASGASSTTSSTSRRSRRGTCRSNASRSASATSSRTPSGCWRRARTKKAWSSPAASRRTSPRRSSAIPGACDRSSSIWSATRSSSPSGAK